MLLTLACTCCTRGAGGDVEGENRFQSAWHLVAWAACAVLVVAAASNLLGNVSLSAMLVSATLDSSYAALAIYAGAKVVVSLSQVLLAGPTVGALAAALLVVAGTGGGHARPRAAGRRLAAVHAAVVPRLPAGVDLRADGADATSSSSASCRSAWAAWCPSRSPPWCAFWLAKTIRQVLAEDVLPGLSLPRGVGNSISSLSYYVVLFLGLLAALAAAGFQVGQLTLVFGALGVGIGFGLQDVVRNFVSGLILMFERPLQRGDTVEVAGVLGQVREIGLRATIVTTFEGADVVVPNGMLLADKLVNWTLNGTRRRVDLNVSTPFRRRRSARSRCWWRWPARATASR